MSESADTADAVDPAVHGAVARRYARLLRAYPHAWREANGPAVLGVMLDAAEARNRRRPTPAEAVDVLRQGLGVRLTEALSAEVRGQVAGTAVGTGLGVTIALFVNYSWTRGDFYTGTAVAGPIWFLPAWLLVVMAARTTRLPLRLAAFAITVTALIAVPTLKPGPYFAAPFTRYWALGEGTPTGVVLATPGQILPASAATVTLLLLLAVLTLVGRPTHGTIRRSGIWATAAAGLITGVAVWATPWPDYFSDSFIWSWLGFRIPGLPLGCSVPCALLVVGLLIGALAVRRRRPATAATCALGALALIASSIALALAGPVGIGL